MRTLSRPEPSCHRQQAAWLGSLMVGALALAGCAPFGGAAPTTTTVSYTCVITGTCRVVIPPCAPAVTSPQGLSNGSVRNGLWYSGFGVPKNTPTILGFQPLLPTEVPRGAGWYNLVLLQQLSVPSAYPMLHAGYGFSPPQTTHPPDPSGGSILALDETDGSLAPLDHLFLTSFQFIITGHTPTTVGTIPAMIYRVSVAHANFSGPGGEQLIILKWRSGTVTLRLVAASAGGVEEMYTDPPHEPFDVITAWYGEPGDPETGARDDVLLRMAASVQPFTGCAH